MNKILLNEFELSQYNKYSKLNDAELDDILTRIFDTCSRVNDCSQCKYRHREYENVNCEQDIIALVDEDKSIEIEGNEVRQEVKILNDKIALLQKCRQEVMWDERIAEEYKQVDEIKRLSKLETSIDYRMKQFFEELRELNATEDELNYVNENRYALNGSRWNDYRNDLRRLGVEC